MAYTKALRVEKAPLVGVEASPKGMKYMAMKYMAVGLRCGYSGVDEYAATGGKQFPVQITAQRPWLNLSFPICKRGLIIDSFTEFSVSNICFDTQ